MLTGREGGCIWMETTRRGRRAASVTCFPLLSNGTLKNLVVNAFLFPGTGSEIQGLEHAEQVCHQLSYIPGPGKLFLFFFLKN